MKAKTTGLFRIMLILLTLWVAGCSPEWEITLTSTEGVEVSLNHQVWESYARFKDQDGIPLEQILYGLGFEVIDQIKVQDRSGERFEASWETAAGSARLRENGRVLLQGREISPAIIAVVSSPWVRKAEASILDIAPTTAAALDLRTPEIARGKALDPPHADHVLLLFLDGFGYLRYQESLEQGLIPTLKSLGPPLVGLTTYPPITTVSTASLLTGAPPSVHQVETRGLRKTDQETILEIAAEAGLRVEAVEGEALAFQLRGAATQLSGDRDGNGETDDNVLENALAVLEAGPPDLFLVHFHGIDDLGHEVGPGASPECEKIREVDESVGTLLQAAPPRTLVIIFADHGMHAVEEGKRRGNHAHLIPRDMVIPIWMEYLE